jgi:hypothetical protein
MSAMVRGYRGMRGATAADRSVRPVALCPLREPLTSHLAAEKLHHARVNANTGLTHT